MKNKTIFFQILLLIAITVAVNLVTVNFYFWHDDFSSFYGPQLNTCIHGWPYYSFCTIFDSLFNIFGYKPQYYFALGIILAAFNVIVFYLFSKLLTKSSKISFAISALLATTYIGAGVFLEAWDPFMTYLTLSTLFVSLCFCYLAVYKNFNINRFLLALVTLLLSLSLFHFRSSTNFIPFIGIIILFSSNKLSIKKRLFLSLIVTILSIVTVFVIPLKIQKQPIDSFYPAVNLIDSISNPNKINYLLETLGSIAVVDYIVEIISTDIKHLKIFSNIKIAVGTFSLFGLFIYFIKSKNNNKKIVLFSLIWIFSLFLPFWIRNNFSLNSTHRYIIWVYPGLLIFWSLFSKNKYWNKLTLIFFVVYSLGTITFYNKHLYESNFRKDFYTKLHKEVSSINENTTIYFSVPTDMKSQFNDYFRVGFTPSESAIGTEFKVDYSKIQLITDDNILIDKIKNDSIEKNSLVSIYYDKNNLKNYSENVRRIYTKQHLTNPILYKSKFTKSNNTFTSFNSPLKISTLKEDYSIPLFFRVTLRAKIPDFSLPFSYNCDNCSISDRNALDILKLLTLFTKLNENISVLTENSAESTLPKYMLDKDIQSFWLYNRQYWHQNKYPSIKFNLPNLENVSSVVISTSYSAGLPSDLTVYINGKEIDKKINAEKDKLIVDFNEVKTNSIEIKILKTKANDSPLINEIYFLPKGFDKSRLDEVLKLYRNPSKEIKTNTEKIELTKLSLEGMPACIRWESEKISGEKYFTLKLDNKLHTYEIDIPSLGLSKIDMFLSCLNYPIELELVKFESGLWNF